MSPASVYRTATMDPHQDSETCLLDAMERGLSHEMLLDEVYMPVHESRGWVTCDVTAHDDTFSAYLADADTCSGRFLFRAKLINEVFYISTWEDFDPDPGEGLPARDVVARVM